MTPFIVWGFAALMAAANLSGLTALSWWIVGILAAAPLLIALSAVAAVTLAAALGRGD